tara:strand:- start:48748 stop:48936 length:189 start_codon:yes stop_codon:yes gene_type:complete
MAAQQIGWSTEAKLLWQILQSVKKLQNSHKKGSRVGNQQIGWSTEEKLLWQIARALENVSIP